MSVTLGEALAQLRGMASVRHSADTIADALRVPVAIAEEVLADTHEGRMWAARDIREFQVLPTSAGDIDPAIVNYVSWKLDQWRRDFRQEIDRFYRETDIKLQALNLRMVEVDSLLKISTTLAGDEDSLG